MSVTPLRRALFVLGVAGLVLGIATFVVIVTGEHESERLLRAILTLLVAWSFLGTGLYAWERRPENPIGALMVGVGLTWCISQMVDSDIPALFAIGTALGSVPIAFIFHMLVIFPSGRASSAFDRFVIAYGYLAGCVVAAIPVLFYNPAEDSDCSGCPANPLMIVDEPAVVDGIYLSLSAITPVVIILLVVHFFRRARSAAEGDRSRDAPVWWAGALTTFMFGTLLLTNFAPEEGNYDDIIGYFAMLTLAAVPYAFLGGLLRSRLSETELENLRLDAELEARLVELQESRARIIEAGITARRKLERDLHDGAQQRLVGVALDLRLARSRLEENPDQAAAVLDEAQAELARATEELRELARGIHPAVLSDRGLTAAVDALASRAPLPVDVDASLDRRLPDPVEAAAYFVVAEALTNVARHAAADHAEIGIRQENGRLLVEVRDDGEGGADLNGSGLRGLSDRVAALDGLLDIDSPARRGTTVRAIIPIDRQSG